MTKSHPTVHQIELRIAELSELFNSMDPTPFHHRDLDRDAEEFLESWALEFPRDSRFRIIVHIEKMPAEDPSPLVWSPKPSTTTSTTNRCWPSAACGCS